MARKSFRSFLKERGFNMVSKVRANTSGYLFVTALSNTDPDNAENLYFGQRFQEEGGYTEGDSLRIDEIYVTEVENAQGEARLKLTDKAVDEAAVIAKATATLEAKGYTMV